MPNKQTLTLSALAFLTSILHSCQTHAPVSDAQSHRAVSQTCQLLSGDFYKVLGFSKTNQVANWATKPNQSSIDIKRIDDAKFKFHNYQKGLSNIQARVSQVLNLKLHTGPLQIIVFSSYKEYLQQCSLYSNQSCTYATAMFDSKANTIVMHSRQPEIIYHEYVHALMQGIINLPSDSIKDTVSYNLISESLAEFFTYDYFLFATQLDPNAIHSKVRLALASKVYESRSDWEIFQFHSIPSQNVSSFSYHFLPKLYEFWLLYNPKYFKLFIDQLLTKDISSILATLEKLIQTTNHCQLAKFLDGNNHKSKSL